MKKILVHICLLSICLCSRAVALPIPKPIEGSASIISPSFTTTAGDFSFSITLPAGWGIGEMQVSHTGCGSFHLFPTNGGIGCSMEISSFDQAALARESLESFRRTFKSVSEIEGGFEVELSKAFYACRLQGEQLIQIWYSLPKKKKEHVKNWKMLKNCLSLSRKLAIEQAPQEWLPIVQSPFHGWICHHPHNDLRVMFDPGPLYTGTANTDDAKNYLLEFKSWQCQGFFYVKWDLPNLDKDEPYHEHLQEMLQDVLAIAPTQTVLQDPELNLQEGYAILQGSPYTLVTLSGDGFLFGFAVKVLPLTMSYDINTLIRAIKWQQNK